MVFSGRAVYSTGVFDGIAEDVGDIISMISPYETPFLDAIGDAARPAANVLHEWLEDELNPNTVTAGGSLDVGGTGMTFFAGGSGVGPYFQVGSIFKNNRSGEFIQVSAVTGNSFTITRAYAGTTASTIVSGESFFFISEVALEGADVTGDISRPRTRLTNYCQIFKKDVIVSGTEQAVTHLGNVTNEFDYQKDKRTKEMIRDLEKATIQGKLSGNSIGSATAYRTMKGVWDFISTNVTTLGSGIFANTNAGSGFTPAILDGIIQSAWNQGATDLNLIVCDAEVKKTIDTFNVTRARVMVNDDSQFRNKVTMYEGTFGEMPVLLCRWMPTKSLMVLSTSRCHVLPLQGRSFQFSQVARTGDSMKGMLIGEYTVEVMNQVGLAKAYAVA